MNAETWNTAEREELERWCADARVDQRCVNLFWSELTENIRQRICEAEAMRKP